MKGGQSHLFPKVFDSSSAISIEKAKRMPALRDRKDEVIFPRRVAAELSSQESPLRRLIKKNPMIVTDLTREEERYYLQLLKEPGIDAGEAAAIAVAKTRRYPLVISDAVARRLATRVGIKCLDWLAFVNGKV